MIIQRQWVGLCSEPSPMDVGAANGFEMKKTLRVVLINIIIMVIFLFFFDVITFTFLPKKYVVSFVDYKAVSAPHVFGRMKYPKGYFVRNEERGFDIGINKKGMHWVDGVSYPIWSNSYGCFDDEHVRHRPYVYFAGDSFTWGYTPFEQKFGTIIQKETGVDIFKCGVTHTGQLHQFSKFKELTAKLGEMPKAVFVFYAFNDVANDYAYPHSTVIGGWLVDNVRVDENGKIHHFSDAQLENLLNKKIAEWKNYEENEKKDSNKLISAKKIKRIIKQYSLSANIISEINWRIYGILNPKTHSEGLGGRAFESFYRVGRSKNGKLWFLDNPNAVRNKNALLSFHKYSIDRNIKFFVVLIPPKWESKETKYYEEVRSFLNKNHIENFDLSYEFKKANIPTDRLYWTINGHFNPSGNKIVADLLMRRFPHILGSAR